MVTPNDNPADEHALEIIAQVTPWAGSTEQAWAWFQSQPLPSFGGLTAEALVKQGRIEALKQYIARIEIGGFA